MMSAFLETLLFIINLICTIFASMTLLRFLLQWVKADFYNPLCQFVMKLTNPFLLPLRRIIPGFLGLDWAALVLIILTLALDLALITLIVGPASNLVFFITLVVKFWDLVFNLYFFIIILRVIMSFNPYIHHNPIYSALLQLSEPLLRPIRRFIPPIHGFDLSPLIMMIVIEALQFFVHKALGVMFVMS